MTAEKRKVLTSKEYEAMCKAALQSGDPEAVANELARQLALEVVNLAHHSAEQVEQASPGLRGVESSGVVGEFLLLNLHLCDRRVFEFAGPAKRETFMQYLAAHALLEFFNRFLSPKRAPHEETKQALEHTFPLLMQRFHSQNAEYATATSIGDGGQSVLSQFTAGLASFAGEGAQPDLTNEAYKVALDAAKTIDEVIPPFLSRLK